MNIFIPDGYFYSDHICFGSPGKGSILARGHSVQFPDLSASDAEAWNGLESDIRLFLSSLKSDERLQLIFSTNSDFGPVLDRYEKEPCHIPIVQEVRSELARRYRKRMEANTLLMSNATLYISSKLPKMIKENGKPIRAFDNVFEVIKRSFDQRQQFFDMLLRNYGGALKPLDNAANYRELLSFWAPGQSPMPDPDWLRSIEDLCRWSDIAPRSNGAHGFHLNGKLVGVMVFKTMPRSTWAKTMSPFMDLAIPGLRVILNMEPLGMETEIRHEEERFAKLSSNLDSNLQSEVGLDKHRDRMRRLLSNQTLPFKAQVIVLAVADDRDELDVKMETMRTAIGKTGSETHQPQLATSLVNFFNCATPGFGPWNKYRDYWHRIDDLNLANLWTAGSTPKGDLDHADCIFDGDFSNLVGLELFSGSSPLHMFCAATTGAGKSVLLQTIALQTAHQFKFMAVIDDGLSWMTTCNKLDPTCKPISIRAGGNLTFNPLDTRRLPLAPQHLSSATALCHLLIGVHPDPDQDKLRTAILCEAIVSIYKKSYTRWRERYPVMAGEVSIQAGQITAYQIKHGLDSFLEAYLESEDALEDDERYEPGESNQDLAFSYFRPRDFPTLSDLCVELALPGDHQELRLTLRSLLRPWLRDGRYGAVVDGTSNVDFGSSRFKEDDPLKVVHFELGELAEAESDLRAVAGFLITNQLRNHIQAMPRHIKKQVVIEEMVSFLKVPNAEAIVVDYYQKMRKYSCQVLSIFQNYSTLLSASPKVAKAIVSNSSAMLLLRNHNRKDLDELGSFLPRPLPEAVKDQITRFPKPTDTVEDTFSSFVYARLDSEDPHFTTCRNYISHKVEEITSSSGSTFEQKKKALKTATLVMIPILFLFLMLQSCASTKAPITLGKLPKHDHAAAKHSPTQKQSPTTLGQADLEAAIARANQAAADLESAKSALQNRLSGDNQLKDQLATKDDEIDSLHKQLNDAFSSGSSGPPIPTPTPSLATWGTK